MSFDCQLFDKFGVTASRLYLDMSVHFLYFWSASTDTTLLITTYSTLARHFLAGTWFKSGMTLYRGFYITRIRRRPRKSPPSFACRLEDKLRLQFDHPWRRIRAQTGAINRRGLAHGLGDLSELAAV